MATAKQQETLQPEIVEQPKEQPQAQSSAVSARPAFPMQLRGLEQCFIQPKKAFLSAGGTEQQFAREVNFAMQAMINNPYLIQCAKSYPDYLIEAIKNVSLTGLTLNPELRLGYLIPYKGKVKFQASYMGKVDILIRTGVVKKIEAQLVYENDKFEYVKGTNGYIKHQPNVFGDRGELIGGYFIAVLANGEQIFDAMPKARIDEIKNRSESVKSGKTSPWATDYSEMCRKTVLNWAFKFLPKTGISDEMVKVLETANSVDNAEFEDWEKSVNKKNQQKDDFDEDGFTDYEEVNNVNQ